jgi:hypothetical protein
MSPPHLSESICSVDAKKGSRLAASNVHLRTAMIVGNPHAGTRLMSILLALLMALILLGAVGAYRKGTAPAAAPPLHPSFLFVLLSTNTR